MKRIITFLTMCFIAFNANGATLINDTEIEKEITEIIMPVAKAANIDGKRLKIYIVRDDDFNAFVRGGEDVFIYTGLLKQIKNPNESPKYIFLVLLSYKLYIIAYFLKL